MVRFGGNRGKVNLGKKMASELTVKIGKSRALKNKVAKQFFKNKWRPKVVRVKIGKTRFFKKRAFK